MTAPNMSVRIRSRTYRFLTIALGLLICVGAFWLLSDQLPPSAVSRSRIIGLWQLINEQYDCPTCGKAMPVLIEIFDDGTYHLAVNMVRSQIHRRGSYRLTNSKITFNAEDQKSGATMLSDDEVPTDERSMSYYYRFRSDNLILQGFDGVGTFRKV